MTFFIFSKIVKSEGIKFIDLINYQRNRLGKDILYSGIVLIVSLVVGVGGLYAGSYIFLGSTPPDTMFQALPLWAAILSLILLPLTNSFMETTTYMGYALTRIEKLTKNKKLALSASALALAFQHTMFPLVFDINFLIWRLVSFIPLAFVIGIFYLKRRSLVPIIIAHFFMDLL